MLLVPVLLFLAHCALAHLDRRNSTGLTTAVTWDSHSLSILGQRVFILSGEVHPWRQPNPNLWLDVFQKLKDSGFNTVSFIVNWALHFPTPDAGGGKGDFTEGTYRDIQRFIDDAKRAGLWLIARPGPYINAETSGGGIPGWASSISGSLRTDNPAYTQAWKPYLTSVAELLAKNQITEGGPIILVQAENEFSAGSGRSDYMQDVIDTLRAGGIVVPITFNDQHAGAAGNFSPDKGGEGAVNIYCGDTYPQSTTSHWNNVQTVYYSNHVASAPSNPLCLAEFGGGWLQGWAGTATRAGTGYEFFETQTANQMYEDVFYKDAYAQTATMFMIFGGTNWGQTAEPTVYSSYDYGAGINENRVMTNKMPEMRLQGLFLRVSRDLFGATLLGNGTNFTTSTSIHTAEVRNLDTRTSFYVLRHNDATSTELTTTKLNVTTSLGQLTVPMKTEITLNGRDSKILVTDYVFGSSNITILYSTIEVMTWTTIDDRDYLVLYALPGEAGETTFKFTSAPSVITTDAPHVSASYSGGLLTLLYSNVSDAQYVDIGDGLTIVVLDKTTAFGWHAPVIATEGEFGNYFSVGTNESVLVSGPYLVRNATISGDTLALSGDLNGTTTVEVIVPGPVSQLSWNGKSLNVTSTSHHSYIAIVSGAESVSLPVLGAWKVMGSLPEVNTSFDDSQFMIANQSTTSYTNLPPLSGTQVLYSQQYDFFGGNLIFRGHFNAMGTETGFNLTVQGGFGFGYSAFLNGVFLGSSQGNATVSETTNIWSIPDGALQAEQDNVLTIIQDHMGLVETSTSSGKEPRGIRGYRILGSNATFTSWRIQGNQGGAANTPDAFRGYMNEGGLYAERIGAHLPGFDDSAWGEGSPVASDGGGLHSAGINFYRTTFDWDVPLDVDVPLRLNIVPSNISQNYRVQIYLNGWQLGKYINNLGPQTAFVLPPGILRRRTTNILALSLWSLDNDPTGLAGLELASDGTLLTSFDFSDYMLPPEYISAGRPPPAVMHPM